MTAARSPDRLVVVGGLASVTLLAWLYLARLAPGTGMAEAGAGAAIGPWGAGDFALMFAMWAVMMVAMMLPAAVVPVTLYATMARRGGARGVAMAPAGLFAGGYVIAWTGFSLAATALQWALGQAALLSPGMAVSSPALGGAALIGAGLYQWSPAKEACLRHCRSPFALLTHGWRAGPWGALRMGIGHGGFCIGCCWMLMGLLFVGGVMNLLWVAAIAIFVLIEKLAPFGPRGGRIAGLGMVAAGLALLGLG